MGLFGRGNGKSKIAGQAPEVAEIPSMIAERLMSEHDPLVLSAILSISQEGKKYRTSEVVDKLAEVLQYPHGEEVIQKAGDALVEKLKNGIHFEDAQLIIANRLARRTEANAKLFLKMLDRLAHKADIKKLAIEMLASFRGVELKPELVDSIEMALLQRMMDPQESDCVKKAIKDRFGKEGKGRPQIKIEDNRGDPTIAADIGPAPGQDSAKMMKAREIPTQTMDVVEGLFLQLKDGTPAQKERAAKALAIMVQNSQSRSQVEKIVSGAQKAKEEVPALCNLCDMILAARKEMPIERGSIRPPMALGPQIGDGNGAKKPLGDKDPTPIVPIKTR